MKMGEVSLIERILEVVEEEGRFVDVNHVATRLGVHWITVYKAVADLTFKELRDNYRAILYAMPIIPLKTTKSLILAPRGAFTVKEEGAK